MAKLAIKKASTDVTVYLFIQASNVTTGAGLAGLAYNTADLVASYIRPLGARAALSLATQTVEGAHSDGGFVEIDSTNMPGLYRLDLSDAVCATGVNSVVVMLKGAANMSPLLLEIQLTDFDLNDATPNVTVSDIATDALTAAAVKADAVTKIQNGLALEATLTAIKGAGWATETLSEIYIQAEASAGSADANTTILNDIHDTDLPAVKAETAAIKAKTDNLPADPADESSLEAAIAAVPTLDAAGVRTAVGLAAANLDTQLSAIQADLDDTSQYKADVSGLATAVALATVDSNVDAIKAKTDNLPTDPADQSILAAAIAALPLASDYTPARAAKLDYLDAAISSRATSGEGTISWTYTLTASDNVTPITYATVWVTSNAAGTAIEASGQTDAAGQVTFLLNAGTYYVWRRKSGYRFQNPDIEVVV